MNFKKEEKTVRESAGRGQGISELEAIALSDLDSCVGGREGVKRFVSLNIFSAINTSICLCCIDNVRGQKAPQDGSNPASRPASRRRRP